MELNTRGVCHVEMGMVTMAFEAFDGDRFDYLFLENIGNLVCPADFDTAPTPASCCSRFPRAGTRS